MGEEAMGNAMKHCAHKVKDSNVFFRLLPHQKLHYAADESRASSSK